LPVISYYNYSPLPGVANELVKVKTISFTVEDLTIAELQKRTNVYNKNLKILESSKMVGFFNVNTFIAAFKRVEGITPNTFRKLSRV